MGYLFTDVYMFMSYSHRMFLFNVHLSWMGIRVAIVKIFIFERLLDLQIHNLLNSQLAGMDIMVTTVQVFAPRTAGHVNTLTALVVVMLVGWDPTVLLVTIPNSLLNSRSDNLTYDYIFFHHPEKNPEEI